MKHKAIIVSVMLGIIVVIGLLYFTIYIDWQMDKSIYSYYELAYAAGDAEQMSDFFNQLLTNMQKEGMTEGHYAMILKTPRNNVAIDYEIFTRLRDRSKHLYENYDKGSFDYAETMDDIKQQMNKTGFDPTYWFIINKRLLLFILWGVCFFSIFFVLGGSFTHTIFSDRKKREQSEDEFGEEDNYY